jgi:hypothetical protein
LLSLEATGHWRLEDPLADPEDSKAGVQAKVEGARGRAQPSSSIITQKNDFK